MRDKEWLKEQFTYYREAVGQTFNDVSRGMNNAYDNVEKLIDQLEEPEITLNDVIARLDGLEKENRLSWISKIMHSFKIEYNDSKWKSEYEQLWINSYEVEKEKNYEVIIGEGTLRGYPSLVVLYKSIVGVMVLKEMTVADYEDSKRRVPASFWLTEKEIKDYNERYWVFAEEVVGND